ncbi:MAG: PEP-CTERM sorting domain-containing protein [Planctomycetota bacterium]
MSATLDDSTVSTNSPDTVIRAFSGGVLYGPNDDSSTLGNGLGSGLFNQPIAADGVFNIDVSGFADFDFTGNHTQTGRYDLVVDIFDDQSQAIDSLLTQAFLAPGAVDSFAFADPAYAGGSFTAQTDNAPPVVPSDTDFGDVDFYEFNGLTPNTIYTAQLTGFSFFGGEEFDTILGWFDDQGQLLASDDDGGSGFLSTLEITTDAQGVAVLAVSGFPDLLGFEGHHSYRGTYSLNLIPDAAAVPEPTSLAALFALGWSALGQRRRATT